MNLIIRPAISSDQESWLQMITDYDADNAPHAERDWKRLMQGDTTACCLIADVDGEQAGFAHTLIHDFVFRRRPCCYLADLYVRPEFRRQGLARAMLIRVLDDAKRDGCGRVYWITGRENPARTMYDEVARSDFVRYRVDF